MRFINYNRLIKISSIATILTVSLQTLTAQKVGIFTASPQTFLDVNGSVAFREGVPLSMAGQTGDNLALTSYSLYRLTDATANFTLTGLTDGTDGRIVILVNSTSYSMTLGHQSSTSTTENRIVVNGGSNLVLASNGIVTLMYINSMQRWLVTSFSGALEGGVNAWNLTGNAGTAAGTNFIGTTDAQDVVVKANNTEGVRLTSSGNLGIGTSTPTNKLSVSGNANITQHIAVGANAAVDDGALLQSGSTFKNIITAEEELSGNLSTDFAQGTLSHLSINATNSPTTEFYGTDGTVEVKTGNTQSYNSVVGTFGGAYHRGTGTVSKLFGLAASAQNKAAGTVSDLRGLHVFTANNSTGTLTNAYGIFTKSINNIGAGSVGNAYGLYVDAACNTGGGAVANNYGVFIEDNSTVGTSSFNLYSKGNDSKNYFAGSVGIGTTAPAAKLEINKSIPDGTNQSLLVLTAQGGGYNHGSSIDFRNTASGYYAGIAAVDDAQYDGRIEFRVSNNGVTNSSPLTTADAAMTILRTGNVGIGTTTPKSDLEVIGSVGHSIMTTSGSLTLNATHHTVIITGTHTITLPAANSCTNRVYIIVNNSGGTRTISSYINIGGSSTTSISSSTSITIQSNGTSWYRIK